MPKGVAWPLSQPARPSRAWCRQRLLPTPGGPKSSSRCKWPGAGHAAAVGRTRPWVKSRCQGGGSAHSGVPRRNAGATLAVSPPHSAAAGLGTLGVTAVGEAARSGLLEAGGHPLAFRLARQGGVQGGRGRLALGRGPVALSRHLGDQLRAAHRLAALAQHQGRRVQSAELLGGGGLRRRLVLRRAGWGGRDTLLLGRHGTFSWGTSELRWTAPSAPPS